ATIGNFGRWVHRRLRYARLARCPGFFGKIRTIHRTYRTYRTYRSYKSYKSYKKTPNSKPGYHLMKKVIGRLLDKFILWSETWFFVWMLVLVQSLWHRRKMSHNNGMAAAGKL